MAPKCAWQIQCCQTPKDVHFLESDPCRHSHTPTKKPETPQCSPLPTPESNGAWCQGMTWPKLPPAEVVKYCMQLRKSFLIPLCKSLIFLRFLGLIRGYHKRYNFWPQVSQHGPCKALQRIMLWMNTVHENNRKCCWLAGLIQKLSETIPYYCWLLNHCFLVFFEHGKGVPHEMHSPATVQVTWTLALFEKSPTSHEHPAWKPNQDPL